MPSPSSAQPEAAPAVAPVLPAGEALRRFIAARLDPLDSEAPASAFRSDLDLNPDLDPLAYAQGFEPAAVLIGLIERAEGLNVLLTRRADSLRRHAGQIAFPGGRCEPGEAAWRTALREAHEEIGLEPGRVSLLGLSTPFRLQTGYHVTPAVGFVEPAFQPRCNPDEVAEVFEAPFAFLMDPANYERHRREGPGPARWVYAATYGERVIWGATAAMLRTLQDRLWGGARG